MASESGILISMDRCPLEAENLISSECLSFTYFGEDFYAWRG